MQAAEQTRIQRATSPSLRSSSSRPSRSPSCSTVSSGSTNSLATPTSWKPEPVSTKDKQLTLERMMMNQQSQQQQMLQQQQQQQQVQMQMYMNNIVYAQHQFNMQQEHMISAWNVPPFVHTPNSQIQRAKTIDKHIKATVLQSDVPHYQEYTRARPKPRVVPSPASVFAKSRQMAEQEEDDDKPLAYLQDESAQKSPALAKSQSSPNLSARKGPVPNVKFHPPPPTKKPGQKPHRRSPLAEYNTVAQTDIPAQNNDDLDFIIDMYQDFKVSYDTDQLSVVSTGSKPDTQISVFSWLKGNKTVRSSNHKHFSR
ncbi:hypothetical protein BGW37DRAFT_494945 [Umbelopsis sp. PMI_123]|nr:hypothetical protein BGW37DRAFT_494945 [Umbelopsis sp. PMI_123]